MYIRTKFFNPNTNETMKRILTLAGLLAVMTATHTNAQTIQSSYVYDSCANGTIGATVSSGVQVSGAASGCKVEINHGDGSKTDTATLSLSGSLYLASFFHQYTTGGTYTIKHVLICSGNRIDSASRSVNNACVYIGGRLYLDANANCALDLGEHLVGSVAQIQVDSAGVLVDTVYGNGYWQYKMRGAGPTVYKFTVLGNPAGYVKSCPASGQITYTHTGGPFAVGGKDFAFSCSTTPTYDYQLYLWRALRGATSPGASYIGINVTNSTCNAGTGTVTLNVSPKFNITTSGITPTPASVSGNTVIWNITGMANWNFTYLYVPLTPKSTTNNGDTACNYAVIAPTADANPANNTWSKCDTVKASWDPNEKSVSPDGPVAAGSTLTYTINFENLGNDTAFNVRVQDTLSSNLDASSFALLGSTHRVIPYVYQSGSANVLKFDFANINLEDKTVPSRNKGQVRFTIKLRSSLTAGTVTPNRAGIYFDGNPVVLTNYAYSRIQSSAGVPGAGSAESIKMFPNPATDAITVRVSTDGWNEAVLSNALGQVMLQQALTRGENILRVAGMPAGIYYLQAKGSAGTLTQKIEKQ